MCYPFTCFSTYVFIFSLIGFCLFTVLVNWPICVYDKNDDESAQDYSDMENKDSTRSKNDDNDNDELPSYPEVVRQQLNER